MPQSSDTLFAKATARNFRAVVFWQNDRAEFPHHHSYAFSKNRLKSYRTFLGVEHSVLLIDFTESFHADALLALAGTLVGGGVLIIKIPEQPEASLRRLQRFCNGDLCQTVSDIQPVLTSFEHLLRQPLTNQPNANSTFRLTKEQVEAFDVINTNTSGRSAYLLNAPRGRGKSSLIGYWLAARATQSSSGSKPRYFVCAPSKRQASALIDHAGNANFTFVAPDQLTSLKQSDTSDWLIIDEAASLPAHILHSVLALPCNMLAATTTEGYESSGRSYALRFQHALTDYFKHVETLTLTTPIRWAQGDPLEQALNSCFFLEQEQSAVTPELMQSTHNGSTEHTKYRTTQACELNEDQLRQCFRLLMDAHYQTSPNDLKLLLDDPRQYLFLQLVNGTLVGVIWFDAESLHSTELAQAIYEGRRRPSGNLLTQSLIYFLRLKDAHSFKAARIVRIAVAPAIQNRGLGTALLKKFSIFASQENFDLIGTSFGVSAQLARFWQQNNFQCVRLGQRRDPASGYFSAIYLKSLNASAQNNLSPSVKLFRLCCQHSPQFSQYPTEVTQVILNEQADTVGALENQELRLRCLELIQDYVSGYIEFTHMRITVAAGVIKQVIHIDDRLLKTCICSAATLQELAREAGFAGKKQLAKMLREICTREQQSI